MTSNKVYWDTCAWIALINQEANRYPALKYVYDCAQRGEKEIWTSTFTYAEVFKKNCGDGNAGSFDESDDVDSQFHNVLTQDFLKLIILDQPIGVNARKLLRANPGLKKPQDAVHLASALRWNVDELHTFDGCDLLKFDRKLKREDGELLAICVPSENEGMPLFHSASSMVSNEKTESAK